MFLGTFSFVDFFLPQISLFKMLCDKRYIGMQPEIIPTRDPKQCGGSKKDNVV
jgi:hypothetical protein